MPPTNQPPDKLLRIVVADDDVTNQWAIEWLLRRTCDVVQCVSTGTELVEAAAALQPDVIVCDAMIPAFFGSGALQRLRTAGPFAFVLVSAEPRDLQQWIEQGASCVIHSMDLDSDLVTAVQAAAAGDIFISRRAIGADPSSGH